MQYKFILNDLETTQRLAKGIAQVIVPNFVVSLSGNLGAGKTTLTREVLRNLGITGSIKSPTFTLVEPYQLPDYTLYHFDLYRFSDPEEWFDAGFDEYFSVPQVSFIEWAEKAQGLIPQIDWQITISFKHNLRELIIDSLTITGDTCLTKLINSDVI
ncbi:MAG TPA: tRNA (adenosine(37)-N6)-threonylcarbamoyltransferase complex ATPase subunit type 1 TsaE [Neisseriales bacterium]|jgi:tRNA threonylcarbamoyladenosine biosynthesis protein TsaE|nr:tRNA (adenosine(37)-N6)-threonylcarbamoyltransferase complex ATPase subunit type 1 TsaE [Neisseriales bacterium]